MTNQIPPWVDNCEFMSGCLISLYNHTGVHPVGIGETWIRLFNFFLLKVTGPKAANTPPDDQIYSGLKAGIDGEVHRVQDIWDANSSTKNWSFLLVDEKWFQRDQSHWNDLDSSPFMAVRRSFFSCYCNWSLLYLKNGNGMVRSLYSREGVTQGHPIAMVAYSIGVIPSTKRLKAEFPDITQPWYSDGDGTLGTFESIKLYFHLIINPAWVVGITPNPLKKF